MLSKDVLQIGFQNSSTMVEGIKNCHDFPAKYCPLKKVSREKFQGVKKIIWSLHYTENRVFWLTIPLIRGETLLNFKSDVCETK